MQESTKAERSEKTPEDRLTLQYLGKSEKIVLVLPYLSEQGIEFTAGGTNTVSKQDAAKLLKENPRMFKVVMPEYEELEVVETTPPVKSASIDEIRALLDALPSKKAVCDYCEETYAIQLDGSLKRETLIDDAIQQIKDTADLG